MPLMPGIRCLYIEFIPRNRENMYNVERNVKTHDSDIPHKVAHIIQGRTVELTSSLNCLFTS